MHIRLLSAIRAPSISDRLDRIKSFKYHSVAPTDLSISNRTSRRVAINSTYLTDGDDDDLGYRIVHPNKPSKY